MIDKEQNERKEDLEMVRLIAEAQRAVIAAENNPTFASWMKAANYYRLIGGAYGIEHMQTCMLKAGTCKK